MANHTLPKGSRLLLYGSQARGTAGHGSDWDILILLDKPKIEQSDYDEIVLMICFVSLIALKLFYCCKLWSNVVKFSKLAKYITVLYRHRARRTHHHHPPLGPQGHQGH